MRSTGRIVEAIVIRPSLEACRYLSKKRLNGSCYSNATIPTHECRVEEVTAEGDDDIDALLTDATCQEEEKVSVSSDSSSTQALTDISDFSDATEPFREAPEAVEREGTADGLTEEKEVQSVEEIDFSDSTEPFREAPEAVEREGTADGPTEEKEVQCVEEIETSNDEDEEEFWNVLRTASPQNIGRKRSCLKSNTNTSSIRKMCWEKLSSNSTKKGKEKSKMKRSVRFGEVAIREYGVELGDNPSCVSGPAVTLSWEYVTKARQGLVNYEKNRGIRRGKQELRLTHHERERILFNNGFAYQEMAVAVENATKDKIRRMRTVLNFKYSRYEEKLEDACGKFLRLLNLKKNDEEMIKALWEEASLDGQDEVRAAALRHMRQQDLALAGLCE